MEHRRAWLALDNVILVEEVVACLSQCEYVHGESRAPASSSSIDIGRRGDTPAAEIGATRDTLVCVFTTALECEEL